MKFINLIAGSGVGKSTGGAVLYGMLSTAGYRTALIPEYAKAMTWRRDEAALRNPILMFANQEAQLEVLKGQDLEFVIVDGCILNPLVYPAARHFSQLEPLVLQVYNSYDNINFFIERAVPFSEVGRNEKEAFAAEICAKLERLMEKHQIPAHKKMPGDIYAPGDIFTILTGKKPPYIPCPEYLATLNGQGRGMA